MAQQQQPNQNQRQENIKGAQPAQGSSYGSQAYSGTAKLSNKDMDRQTFASQGTSRGTDESEVNESQDMNSGNSRIEDSDIESDSLNAGSGKVQGRQGDALNRDSASPRREGRDQMKH
jgi:hypothetical protein